MKSEPLSRYAGNPVAFIDDMIAVNERGQPFRLSKHQRTILATAFTFDADGLLPWDTFVYSCVKKSGKTTINGALTAWWAFTQEPPNELFVIANDLEQAQQRVFSTTARLIQRNPRRPPARRWSPSASPSPTAPRSARWRPSTPGLRGATTG